MPFIDYLLPVLGLLIALSAAMDWSWLMESRRSQNQARLLGGRGRLRILYIVIGLALAAAGVLRLLGVIA